MKVAVCVSGLVHSKNNAGNVRLYDEIRREKFPECDFYYASWQDQKENFLQNFPKYECKYFKQPTIKYHPYLDIPEEKQISKYYNKTVDWVREGGEQRISWTSHHTKQILIHAWLLDSIKKENYDIIVRTRFDGYIWKDANFAPFLEDSIKHRRSNCFAATVQNRFPTLVEVDMRKDSLHQNWCMDQLIIHPPQQFNIAKVFELNNKKLLHAAEYGWYQILSMPYKSNHRNFSGWVNHDSNVLEKFIIWQ